jgi:ketosteroid isomerase-like protein
MSINFNRRDVLGMSGAAALAAGIGISGIAPARSTATDANSSAPLGNAERNKRWVRENREVAQHHALPSALPGEEGLFDPKALGMMGKSPPKIAMVSNDSPVLHSMSQEELKQLQGGFASQALGPTFISYGPMLAEGDFVIEEWESQIYGANGTLYNNQYLSVTRIEGDQVALFHEYNDTQHAALIYGPLGKWPELKPPTNPRRRNRHGAAAASTLPASEVETVFEVIDKFDLDPRLLADVAPSASAPPVRVKPGVEGNKALVRALRHAKASGDAAAVNSFYAKGFRHFLGGERPFCWDHIPLAEIYAPLVKHMASPLTVYYGPMVAEGDRVFEQMDSFARLDDGTVYNNWHAFVHEIRDGKIVQTREYHDPRHVWVVLGRWASWGATPVAPRSSPRRSNLQGIYSTIQYPTTFGPDLDRWKPFPPLPG